jgi:hypothetical protein
VCDRKAGVCAQSRAFFTEPDLYGRSKRLAVILDRHVACQVVIIWSLLHYWYVLFNTSTLSHIYMSVCAFFPWTGKTKRSRRQVVSRAVHNTVVDRVSSINRNSASSYGLPCLCVQNCSHKNKNEKRNKDEQGNWKKWYVDFSPRTFLSSFPFALLRPIILSSPLPSKPLINIKYFVLNQFPATMATKSLENNRKKRALSRTDLKRE